MDMSQYKHYKGYIGIALQKEGLCGFFTWPGTQEQLIANKQHVSMSEPHCTTAVRPGARAGPEGRPLAAI